MSVVIKKSKILMSFLTWILLVPNGHAAILIDDFTDFQFAINEVNGPVAVNGSQLTNLTRTLTASASLEQDAETEVVADDSIGVLSIANNSDSTGAVSVFYSFDLIDLTLAADALLFNLDFIDLSHEIQIIANNSSIYGFAGLGGVGEHLIKFTQFTDPLAFKQLTSLELKFRGEKAWDALYGAISTNTTTVPEPSVIALLSIGLIFFSRVYRRAYV